MTEPKPIYTKKEITIGVVVLVLLIMLAAYVLAEGTRCRKHTQEPGNVRASHSIGTDKTAAYVVATNRTRNQLA